MLNSTRHFLFHYSINKEIPWNILRNCFEVVSPVQSYVGMGHVTLATMSWQPDWCPVIWRKFLPLIWLQKQTGCQWKNYTGSTGTLSFCDVTATCPKQKQTKTSGIILWMHPGNEKTTLQCNIVSHWQGTCTKWSLATRLAPNQVVLVTIITWLIVLRVIWQ